MQRIKILQIIPTLDQSGAEKQLALLASNLSRDQFEVRVCALTRGGYYEPMLRAAGIEVAIVGKRFKCDPVSFWRLRQAIAGFRPDVVHTWLFAANSYGRIAARWAGRPRVVAAERCVDSWKRSDQLLLDRLLAGWTDAIVVNSQAVAAFYQKSGIPAEKLRVIRNAVEPAAEGSERNAVLAELGIAPETPVIGFVGRLWPQKRVQDLIWATDILKIAGWKLRLLIVGDGPRRTALERFARNLELGETVQFLGHRADAQRLLGALDVVVLPSKFEGMPNVVLEAMRLGKPVIATRIAGMDEVVADGQTGLLVPPQKPFELARAIRRLLLDSAWRARLGAAGQARAAEHFSVAKMVDAYGRLYCELAEGKALV